MTQSHLMSSGFFHINSRIGSRLAQLLDNLPARSFCAYATKPTLKASPELKAVESSHPIAPFATKAN
jgi:hypothetical protein